ncbi:MAG: vanadium-dependent haloperoxidase, partial [Chitinophagaceae bacterium]
KLAQLPVDAQKITASVGYGRKAGELLFKWAAADGYLQRNARPAYIVTKQAGRWIPTPPDYMDAVEPNWKTLRPYFLDSAAQFRPVPPLAFDSSRSSPYFQQVKQVYEAVKDSAPESALIARFWDCNPNISVTQGHVTYFQQKISPGGHWVHIAAAVCDKEKYDLLKAAQLLSTTALAIAEGFISCWEAKYYYTTIRPETVINRYWDKDWRPLLQTPPFPEYPSGHSVVSGAASSVLSALVSPAYSFTDSTEVAFGMPVRTFSSFLQAGQEASRSRLYGGIHYPQALDNGFAEGQAVANYLLRKLSH